MDRSEARLKFGNSLATSSISSFIIASIDAERARAMDTSGKKSDDKRKRKDATAIDRLAAAEAKRALAAAGDGEPTMSIGGTQRADFCGYFLSLLRSHSSENGDDLPIIEYNALKSVVFVVEAYLFHINLMDELNAILAEKTSDDDVSNFVYRIVLMMHFLCIFGKIYFLYIFFNVPIYRIRWRRRIWRSLKWREICDAFINGQSPSAIRISALRTVITLSNIRPTNVFLFPLVHICFNLRRNATFCSLFRFRIERRVFIMYVYSAYRDDKWSSFLTE